MVFIKVKVSIVLRIFFFLFSCNLVSQSLFTINGVISDEKQLPVEGVSAILKSRPSNKIITYAVTDSMGKYDIEVENIGSYVLEFSHISYEKQFKEIVISDINLIYVVSIVLLNKLEVLDEVVIQQSLISGRVKNDTLSYNLRAYTTGNEQKLKDILKKLPGIEVDGNGNIKSDGKKIDNLLVDGKPFFGNNHKIATDNLNAEMIDGVDLLSNYEKSDIIKEVEGGNETAINIKIKDAYKGKPTGSFEAFGAYKNRYKLHANLFSFSEKINLSIITDLNNTGEQPMSVMDYLEMDVNNKNISNADTDTRLSENKELPTFLRDKEKHQKINSQFVALNATYASTNSFGFTIYSVLNKQKQQQEIFKKSLYFDTQEERLIVEQLNNANTSLFHETEIQAEYKPTEHSLLSYSLHVKPMSNDGDAFIESNFDKSTQNTIESTTGKKLNLHQELYYVQKIEDDKLLTLGVSSSILDEKDKRYLQSDAILFDIGNQISQRLKFHSDTYGAYAKYAQYFKKKMVLKASFGHTWEYNQLALIDWGNLKDLNQNNYWFVGMSLEKRKDFFQFKTALAIKKYDVALSSNNADKVLFLPSISTKLNFSETHYLELAYEKKADYPSAKQLNSFGYVVNYRNFQRNSNVYFAETIVQQVWNLNYFNFNLYSGMLFYLRTAYQKRDGYVGVNNEVINGFNYSNFINTDGVTNWLNILKFEKRISSFQNKFKFDGRFSITELHNTVRDILNVSKTTLYSGKASFESFYKDALINYDIGLSFEVNTTDFSLFSEINEGTKWEPFVDLDGRVGKSIGYSINNSFVHYKTNTGNNRRFYNLGFRLDFKKNKSNKLAFWVEGDNILNTQNPEIIDVYNSGNMLSQSIILQLSGYIGGGVSFDF